MKKSNSNRKFSFKSKNNKILDSDEDFSQLTNFSWESVERYKKASNQSILSTTESIQGSANEGDNGNGDWYLVYNEEGDPYYYNMLTLDTTWERPSLDNTSFPTLNVSSRQITNLPTYENLESKSRSDSSIRSQTDSTGEKQNNYKSPIFLTQRRHSFTNEALPENPKDKLVWLDKNTVNPGEIFTRVRRNSFNSYSELLLKSLERRKPDSYLQIDSGGGSISGNNSISTRNKSRWSVQRNLVQLKQDTMFEAMTVSSRGLYDFNEICCDINKLPFEWKLIYASDGEIWKCHSLTGEVSEMKVEAVPPPSTVRRLDDLDQIISEFRTSEKQYFHGLTSIRELFTLIQDTIPNIKLHTQNTVNELISKQTVLFTAITDMFSDDSNITSQKSSVSLVGAIASLFAEEHRQTYSSYSETIHEDIRIIKMLQKTNKRDIGNIISNHESEVSLCPVEQLLLLPVKHLFNYASLLKELQIHMESKDGSEFDIDPDFLDRIMDKLLYTGKNMNERLREMEAVYMMREAKKQCKGITAALSTTSQFEFRSEVLVHKGASAMMDLSEIASADLIKENGKVNNIIVFTDRIILTRPRKYAFFASKKQYVKETFLLDEIKIEQLPLLSGKSHMLLGFRLVLKSQPLKLIFVFDDAISKAKVEMAIRKALKEYEEWKRMKY